ncbi:hypothetical protein AB0K05_12020 [Nonomuraea sp. NPDC049486]|uniref:hypothetical protein n=1 Tax=unclassified Nonomuraea TaxID=2593643 RepID=UPI003432E6FF
MAELIKHVVVDIRSAWNGPMVVDPTVLAGEDHAPWDEEWSPSGLDGWARVGRNAVVFDKHTDIDACIRLELWTDEPSMTQPMWNRMWAGEIYLRSGQLQIHDFYEAWSRGDVFDLGQRDATWAVRIQHRRLENDQEPDFPRDIYQVDIFKLQFWMLESLLT